MSVIMLASFGACGYKEQADYEDVSKENIDTQTQFTHLNRVLKMLSSRKLKIDIHDKDRLTLFKLNHPLDQNLSEVLSRWVVTLLFDLQDACLIPNVFDQQVNTQCVVFAVTELFDERLVQRLKLVQSAAGDSLGFCFLRPGVCVFLFLDLGLGVAQLQALLLTSLRRLQLVRRLGVEQLLLQLVRRLGGVQLLPQGVLQLVRRLGGVQGVAQPRLLPRDL